MVKRNDLKSEPEPNIYVFKFESEKLTIIKQRSKYIISHVLRHLCFLEIVNFILRQMMHKSFSKSK
jgi:hypothetical protein